MSTLYQSTRCTT